MAEAAVGFLLQNLAQLLKYHGGLIVDAENQVDNLSNNLRLLRQFLVDLSKKRRKDGTFKELVRQIEDAVYKAEDIVDKFITQAAEKRFRVNNLLTLHDIATDVQNLTSKMKLLPHGQDMLDMSKTDNALDEGNAEKKEPIVREVNIVGFKDEEKKLIGYLKEKSNALDVITIVGLPGQGKTTLAGMIFRNREIEIEFPTLIWVYVSQEFDAKDIFLQILGRLTTSNIDDMKKKSKEDLAKIVKTLLRDRSFLIVMDDVWTTEDWDELNRALPSETGKVLLTSRHVDVALHANRIRDPHNLRFLTPEESLFLLKLEVFGEGKFPEELKPLGELIVERCEWLPLAIVIIGGFLATKISRNDPGARKREWKKVSERVGDHLFMASSSNGESNKMENIIALSYDKLPYHLKACFLYMGLFPEDCEIPASKLTRMWMAEGLVQDDNVFSLEETAERCLNELINRNLLRRDKVSRDGKVKTCRIHDTLRDFCIKRNTNSKRRHFVHSNLSNFLLSPISVDESVRSFASFSKEEFEVPTKNSSAVPKAFKMLRVLESKPIIFPLFPDAMFKLVHLRYITISMAKDPKVNTIPKAFSSLWNIQSLIVHTKSATLVVKADIWKMSNLRHFETNASATLPEVSKDAPPETQLQTLGRVSPESCTEEVIKKVSKVRKLSIRGKLVLLLGTKNVSFNNLEKLHHLEKMKLLNDASLPKGKLPRLPPAEQFPPKLMSLTLTKTSLDWKQMSILGQLENLEILILKEKAFEGEIWNLDEGGFGNLGVLHIQRVDFVKWTVAGCPFPCLRRVELKNCQYLEIIPVELADIPGFQVLDLYRCEAAATSAKSIKERKEKTAVGQEENQGGTNKFELSIFPSQDT